MSPYYRQLRFWTKIFVLTFAIGVASGIPLEFEFGTNWAAFSTAAGDFLGNILGFESTVAFALEAAFLGVFVFGWKRVHPYMHLFANGMVALGATLSAFWIMVANSWMQIPGRHHGQGHADYCHRLPGRHFQSGFARELRAYGGRLH